MPRMGWIRAESYRAGEAVGEANPAVVQMGNTDLKARALSREETKEEGTDGEGPGGSSHQPSLGERCAF